MGPLRKLLERTAWQLDLLHSVGKFGQFRKTWHCVGGAKSCWLRRNRHAYRASHLTQDRDHAFRFLLTVRPNRMRSRVDHRPGAFSGRMSIATLRQLGTERHGRNHGQARVARALEPDQHLLQMEKCFHDQELDSGSTNESNLFFQQIAYVRGSAASLALKKLGPGNRGGHISAVSRYLARDLHGRIVDRFGLRTISGTS